MSFRKWQAIVADWVEKDKGQILERGDTRARLSRIRREFLRTAKISEQERKSLYVIYLAELTAEIGNRRGTALDYDGNVIWIGG